MTPHTIKTIGVMAGCYAGLGAIGFGLCSCISKLHNWQEINCVCDHPLFGIPTFDRRQKIVEGWVENFRNSVSYTLGVLLIPIIVWILLIVCIGAWWHRRNCLKWVIEKDFKRPNDHNQDTLV